MPPRYTPQIDHPGCRTALNDQLTDEERITGIRQLRSLQSPDVLRFYRAVLLYAPDAVKDAAIEAAADHINDPETLSMTQLCLAQPSFIEDSHRKCIALLEKQGSEQAADILYTAASNSKLKASIRDAAQEDLRTALQNGSLIKAHLPAYPSLQGQILAIGGVGAAGSAILMGIGELGVSDAAIGDRSHQWFIHRGWCDGSGHPQQPCNPRTRCHDRNNRWLGHRANQHVSRLFWVLKGMKRDG